VKILHVIYDDVGNPWVGGGGAVRSAEINRVLSGDHKITVLTSNYPGAVSETINRVNYRRCGVRGGYFLSRLTFALCVPFLVRKCDFDLLVNEFSVFSPCYCHWYTKKPVIHTFYHFIGRQAFKKFFVLGFFSYLFEKIFLKTARNIITISPSVTKQIERPGSKRNIRCIFTGVSGDLLSVEPKPGEYIAFIGRLDVYMKGLDLLLEAFSRLARPGLELRIAGSGPDQNREQLEQLAVRLSIRKSVSFLGRISDEEKKDFLSRAYFIVMPSRFEGWGMTAVEAAACGKAVIGTDIPGLRDAVIHGKTGILVESENPEQLANAMADLLDDERRRSELGAGGKTWACKFSWESIARKQEKFYKEVVADQD